MKYCPKGAVSKTVLKFTAIHSFGNQIGGIRIDSSRILNACQNHPEKWEQHRQRAGDQEGIFEQCAQLTWQLVFLFHHALPFLVIMDEPLGHLVLDHRHDRNDDEPE